MRFTHRRCRHEIEGLATAALRQTERAEDLALENKDLADRLHEAEMAARHLAEEIDAACEDPEYTPEAVIPEYLREKLLDAHDRQFVLDEHSRALRLLDEYERGESVLQARRRRAAETALGEAWHESSTEWAARRAAVAQAVLALPLEAFDVEVTYEHGRWYVAGERFAAFAFPYVAQERLQERYGLTDEELAQICEGRQETAEATPEESIELLEEQTTGPF